MTFQTHFVTFTDRQALRTEWTPMNAFTEASPRTKPGVGRSQPPGLIAELWRSKQLAATDAVERSGSVAGHPPCQATEPSRLRDQSASRRRMLRQNPLRRRGRDVA